MCIYCGTTKYRKIYEQHHGVIPVDSNGKKFHIHHIDGNHLNNDPENLVALSEHDHFLIHLNRGDYGAASRLARIEKLSANERSELARLSMLGRMSKPDYINPSSLDHVRKKQSDSAFKRWAMDDGSRKKKAIETLNSPEAKNKKLETWNKKSPIYHLQNIASELEVQMTRSEFIIKYFDGKLTNFNDLVPKCGKARRKSVKGWRLLSVINN